MVPPRGALSREIGAREKQINLPLLENPELDDGRGCGWPGRRPHADSESAVPSSTAERRLGWPFSQVPCLLGLPLGRGKTGREAALRKSAWDRRPGHPHPEDRSRSSNLKKLNCQFHEKTPHSALDASFMKKAAKNTKTQRKSLRFRCL